MSPSRTRAARGFVFWTSVKVVVATVLVFVLAGLVIPNLVDAHDTGLLLLAIVCGVLAIGIVIAATVSIRRSYARLRRAGAYLIEARP